MGGARRTTIVDILVIGGALTLWSNSGWLGKRPLRASSHSSSAAGALAAAIPRLRRVHCGHSHAGSVT